MPFSIFNFPQVVISEIINAMDPKDKTCIALCSKKAFQLVKTFTRKSDNININIKYDLLIVDIKLRAKFYEMFNVKSSFDQNYVQNYKKVKIQDKEIKIAKRLDGRCNLFCDNSVFPTLLDWVTDLLPKNPIVLHCGPDSNNILNWVRNRKMEAVHYYERDGRSSEEDIAYLLSDCDAKDVFLFTPAIPSFRYEGAFKPRRCLNIYQGSYLPSNLLTSIDVEELTTIWNSTLSSSDINLFLKHWVLGGNARLKWLHISMEYLNWEEVMEGIKFYKHYMEEQVFTSPSGEHIFMSDTLIKSKNNVYASIERGPEEICFSLAIWPDSKGNMHPQQSKI